MKQTRRDPSEIVAECNTDREQVVKALRLCADDNEICNCPYFDKGFFCTDALMSDAAAAIEELENMLADECKECDYLVDENERLTTENKELQADNAELESCVQTLTEQRDYWKDKAEKIEPKRGEWVYEDLDNFRKYKVTCPHCGAWFVGNYDAYDEPSEFLYCPHCGNICNPTNLDWENELKEREKEARERSNGEREVQDGE